MNVHVPNAAGETPARTAATLLLDAVNKLDGAIAMLEVSVLATRAIGDDDVSCLEEPLRRVVSDLLDIRENIAAQAVRS